MRVELPPDWSREIGTEREKPYFEKLSAFVNAERQAHEVFPAEPDMFTAMNTTPFERASVLILGQDPYHDVGQAHGLSFSVRPGVPLPPSLLNIYKELKEDLGYPRAGNGCLTPWAQQGVLLLNAVLTVRAHAPNSHKGRGWETFTDAAIRALSAREAPMVFVLWGAYAQKKGELIDSARHYVLRSAHPSPLSARNGFFGSRPFSKVNALLKQAGRPEIDWQIPNLA